MAAHLPFASLHDNRLPRRALLIMPAAFVGWLALFKRPERALPDPLQQGLGPPVKLVVFPGSTAVLVRKIARSDAEWRHELSPDEFAVTRRASTELPFTGRYRHTRDSGIYRCTCCGNALFPSQTKFDSGTGWPSFSSPVAPENIYTRLDTSLSEARVEVLCSKCDAHLGHLFNDGPLPAGLRYCLNSAALRFIATPS